MEGKKRSASEADLDFPHPSSDITDPAEVLFFYAELCSEREAPIPKAEVSSTICDIEERGLPHDADRRKVLFGTRMVWRGVVGLLCSHSHHACMLPYCRFWAYCRFWLMGICVVPSLQRGKGRRAPHPSGVVAAVRP